MPGHSPSILEFSQWDGTPFFEGQPEEDRRVYLVKKEEGAFNAYGVVGEGPRYVFLVRGANLEEQERFVEQVKKEGAQVIPGLPPFETQTGGDKPPPTSGSPSGYKGSKPSPLPRP